MENIFEGAEFGDKYMTVGGRMAVYVGRLKDDEIDVHRILYEDAVFRLVTPEGLISMDVTGNPRNIISKWEEPVSEEGITSAELAHQSYGAECQKKIDLDKAVEVYTNELHQIIEIVNGIGKMYGAEELGEIFSVEGCIEDFRKAMEE